MGLGGNKMAWHNDLGNYLLETRKYVNNVPKVAALAGVTTALGAGIAGIDSFSDVGRVAKLVFADPNGALEHLANMETVGLALLVIPPVAVDLAKKVYNGTRTKFKNITW
jgi:hypothetical protein